MGEEQAEDGDSMIKTTRRSEPIFFFSSKEKKRIVQEIRSAEKKSTCEIRVHLVGGENGDVKTHAHRMFEKLGMANTKERSGILIFMHLKSRRFAIIGDQGVHGKVSEDFWKKAAASMEVWFQKDEFARGIEEAILKMSEYLAPYFSPRLDNPNELKDEISYS